MKIEISENNLKRLKRVLDKRIMLNEQVSVFSQLETEIVTKRNLVGVTCTYIYITKLLLTQFDEVEEQIIRGYVNERYLYMFSFGEIESGREKYLKLEKQLKAFGI